MWTVGCDEGNRRFSRLTHPNLKTTKTLSQNNRSCGQNLNSRLLETDAEVQPLNRKVRYETSCLFQLPHSSGIYNSSFNEPHTLPIKGTEYN